MIVLNSFPIEQNGHHFTDNVIKSIFLQKKFCISIQISLKFVPRGPVDNKWALVQLMAWCQKGDKPLSKPMLTQFTDAHMWH